MHLAHLCSGFLIPSTFWKYKAFAWYPKYIVLVYCLYDAFIASILCTTEMGFQFSVSRSHMGMRKDFKGAFKRSSHGNLWCVGRCIIMQLEHKSYWLDSFLWFPGVAASIRLHNMHCLLCDFAKDNELNHDHPLTSPKKCNLLNYLGGGDPGCFHCLLCIFDSGSKWWTHVSSWVTTRSIKSPGSSS